MPLFTSSREKSLWLWAAMVLAAIFSTLFLGRPLTEVLGDQNIQALVFLLGMILVAVATLVHGLTIRSTVEVALFIGILAVYILFFLRLGLAERSHLIEYSVLALFIHKALLERKRQGRQLPVPALWAIALTFLISLIDECSQIFLPDRVFDRDDIIFNALTITMAIGASAALTWTRNMVEKAKRKQNPEPQQDD